MKKVDATGLLCPQPLIMLKKALLEMNTGEEAEILTDNDTSFKNLTTFLNDQGATWTHSREGRTYTIFTRKPDKDLTAVDAAAYCSTGSSEYVICIKSESMGDGEPELGTILIKAFINSLKDQEKLPTHIIFYNSGVKLTVKNSPVIEALTALESLGIRIMVCGTCIDYYGLKETLGVGMISNMYSITETLAGTGHVIFP
ncbi:MAG: sulfurtransferase-like selenium metabolism protein YedF [Bacteroidota bacterium]